MSCVHRVIGVPARLLLLLTVALLVEGAPAPASSSASSTPPALAHPTCGGDGASTHRPDGSSPQDPSRASTVVTARFRPATPGRPVALELRRDGRWVVVERSRLDAEGRASFVAPPLSGAQATYRVS